MSIKTEVDWRGKYRETINEVIYNADIGRERKMAMIDRSCPVPYREMEMGTKRAKIWVEERNKAEKKLKRWGI